MNRVNVEKILNEVSCRYVGGGNIGKKENYWIVEPDEAGPKTPGDLKTALEKLENHDFLDTVDYNVNRQK